MRKDVGEEVKKADKGVDRIAGVGEERENYGWIRR